MQPALLPLEERQLLSTFPVTSTADPATLTAGTLRYAIAEANAATSPSAIEFELGSGPATITLLQGQLELSNASDATTIYEGPGQEGVTISGNNASRVFQVDLGVTASISGLTLTGGNAGTDGYGGGLANYGGNVTLTNCTLSGNSATYGGGVASTGGSTLTLTNCTVSGNTASKAGGVDLTNGALGMLSNCTIAGNYAYSSSGGVNGFDATASLTDCTISGNATDGAGGGLNTAYGSLTLTNCTVSGNYAFGGSGGGVANYGVVTLTNCTLSGNYAYGSGGGLDNDGTATLGNTIVAGNTSNSGGPDVYGAVTSLGHNLIGETDGSSGWVGSDLTGTIATPLEPLLAPLDSYGGPTETMALLPGSPAIDAGSNALVPGGVTTDQRGYAAHRPPQRGHRRLRGSAHSALGQHDRRRRRLPPRHARPERRYRPRQHHTRRRHDQLRPDHLRRAPDDHPGRRPARARATRPGRRRSKGRGRA